MKLPHLIALFLLTGVFHQVSATPTPPAPSPKGYVARMDTVLGNIDIWLRSDKAPITVGNFLNYSVGGFYQNTFFHRSVRNTATTPDVIQGGGFKWSDVAPNVAAVFEAPPITNEYNLSNVRGTIAMARGGGINSATNQWYFNVSDNSKGLDPQFFTVFGSVINKGMDVVDALAAVPVEDQSATNSAFASLLPAANRSSWAPAFSTLPLINHTPGSPVTKQNLALIRNISLLSTNAPVQGASGNYSFLNIPAPPGAPTLPSADIFESAPNPDPATAPEGVTFSEGFFKIVMSRLTNGATVKTILNLPPGSHPNTYYKWGPTPDNPVAHWYNFMWDGTTGAIFENTDPTLVALIFVDGARGDDDLTADGKISDVGGPGIGPATGSSGGGGALDWMSLCAGLLIWLRRGSMRRFR